MNPSPPRRLDPDMAWRAVLAAGTMGLLLLFRASVQTGDSLAYVLAARDGERLFHPHHLLFSVIVRIVYLGLSAVSGAIDALLAAQVHNAVWAAVAVVCVFGILRHRGWSRGAAAAGAAALLACQGFLVLSTLAEVYVPATACSAALFLILERSRDEPATPWWPAALLLALMIFYHQTTVLFCVPLVIMLGLRRRLADAARIVGTAGGLTLAVYVAVFTMTTPDAAAGGFVRWVLGYAVSDRDEWGASAHVGSTGMMALLDRQRWNLVHVPEAMAAVAAVAVGLVLLALVARAAAAVRKDRAGAALQGGLASWLLVHVAFFLWWQPDQREFFVISLVPILLLALTAAGGSPRARRVTAGAALAFTVVALPAHVALALRPLQTGARDEIPQARELLESAPEGCGFYAPRLVIYALRQEFGVAADRVRNARLVRRRALDGDPDPLAAPLETACVALPFSQIDPRAVRGGEAVEPEVWWAFVTRTLRVRSADDGALVFPELSFVPGASGALYVVQDGAPVRVAGREAFCRWLDDRLQADTGRPQAPFSRWLAGVRGTRTPATSP